MMHDGGQWLVQIQYIRYFLDGRIVAQPGAGETVKPRQRTNNSAESCDCDLG